MELYIAWIIPIFAIAFLIYALNKQGSNIARAIYTYICFALIFGCVHFLIFRYHPDYYIVSKELPIPETISALERTESDIDASFKRITLIDVVLLKLAEPTAQTTTFQFSPYKQFEYTVNDVLLQTRIRTDFVGPQRQDPAFHALLNATLESNYRGVAANTAGEFYIKSPQNPEFQMSHYELEEYLRSERKRSIEHVRSQYESGRMTPALFSLTDFFYFSFSITGVGELIARARIVRFIALFQILLTVVIPFVLAKN
ncbi:MAG: hypothetical protein ACLPPF_10450 [Rhodomicrobium sp.]